MSNNAPVTHGLNESGKAAARLKEMARKDGVTCTVSVNGGPEVPLKTLQQAVRRVRPGEGKSVIDAMAEAVSEELAATGGEAATR